MAAYFGEVVLPLSRAFWDVEEGKELINNSSNESEFSTQWLIDKPMCIQKLLIVESTVITDITKECLCHNSKEICVIINTSNKKVSTIHKVNEDLYLCIIEFNFDMKFAGEFVIEISDILLRVENLICITWQHVTQYKSENIPNTPSFLRFLKTKNAKDICKLQTTVLEPPNIIFGIAAGILSYAQMMKKRAVLYALYTDNFVLDSKSAQPLIELYAELTNRTLSHVNFSEKNFFNKGNLYM